MSRLDATLALRALGLNPDAGQPLCFESDVKRAYRRAAMELHPDRNPALPHQQAADMEERFKNAKLAYEFLSVLFEAGLWPPHSPRGPGPYRIVSPVCDDHASYQPSADTVLHPSMIDPINLWAQAACGALVHAAALEGYARAKFLNTVAMWSARSNPNPNPRLSTEFLRAFWSKTEPGIFSAIEQYRAELRALRLGTLADALDPFVASSGPQGDRGFGLLSAIVRAAPPLLSERKQTYYLEAFAATPLLLDCCSTEAFFHGSNRSSEPFLSQLFTLSPQLAEMFATRSKRSALPIADWLVLCVRSAARPAALVHLLESDSLDAILDAAQIIPTQRAEAWIKALSPRAGAEGRWELASFPGASETLILRAKAVVSLASLRADCDELDAARPARLYAPDQSYARRAMSRALDGDAEHALYILDRAPDQKSARTHRGWPLSTACAARAHLEPIVRASMLLAIDALVLALGADILLARDPFGHSAAEWLSLPRTT